MPEYVIILKVKSEGFLARPHHCGVSVNKCEIIEFQGIYEKVKRKYLLILKMRIMQGPPYTGFPVTVLRSLNCKDGDLNVM